MRAAASMSGEWNAALTRAARPASRRGASPPPCPAREGLGRPREDHLARRVAFRRGQIARRPDGAEDVGDLLHAQAERPPSPPAAPSRPAPSPRRAPGSGAAHLVGEGPRRHVRRVFAGAGPARRRRDALFARARARRRRWSRAGRAACSRRHRPRPSKQRVESAAERAIGLLGGALRDSARRAPCPCPRPGEPCPGKRRLRPRGSATTARPPRPTWKPPPKVTDHRFPGTMRPVRRASSMASGMEADEVLP